jgi:CBS domain-containing protein
MQIDYSDTVKCVMMDIITVTKKRIIREVLDIMIKNDIGSLVVVEGSTGIGILTERDIMKNVSSDPHFMNKRVEELMSKPLITINEETPAWDAFRIMLSRKIRRLPIEKDGKLIGIVSERDLFRWVMLVVYEQNTPEDIREIVQKGYQRE